MKLLLPALFLTLTTLLSCKDQKEPTYDDSALSTEKLPLTAPDGWRHDKFNGKAVIVGPTHNGFAANINLAIETADLSLAEYVEKAMALAKKEMPNLKTLKQSPFKTNGGVDGIRHECSNEINNVPLRQTFYIFSADGNRKRIFTSSVHGSQGDKLAPTIDSIIKTYVP